MKPMKKIILCVLLAGVAFASNSFAASWQIKKGEKLNYKIAFSSALTGSIKGGDASLTVKPSTVKIDGREAYHAILKGGTSGVIEWVYKVENLYETFIDTRSAAPLMYRQSVVENKYKNSDTVFFNQSENIASYRNKTYKIPNNTQDFVSMIYYVRTIDVDKLKKGDSFTIPFFTSDKVLISKVVFDGVEKIRSNSKDINCYAFKPQVAKGKVFNHDYPATIWISTDSSRVPVLIEAKMKVGKIKMELKK